MTNALMKRPCTALEVLPSRRWRQKSLVIKQIRCKGHNFHRDNDWRCLSCGAELHANLRSRRAWRLGHPEDFIDPCPNPTEDRFKAAFMDVMAALLSALIRRPEEEN